MAKTPLVQRLKAGELFELDTMENRCPECKAGNITNSDHRQNPPCTFLVGIEIMRRVYRFDDMVERLENIKRRSSWF